ncbi:hypothetical protein QTN47_06020 [Danxiaibacter flavus]|uniref:Vitellogenin II n=1 Tax=Danxiaibacter flavus TaxID=3049108 RepID=A0ABV3ZBZ0_9BACT|nr:hypothetical protein QNM32_06020 [Chitinophagaceae bacterium DXS]
MKKHILYLIGVVMVFASCSTAYKNTQTPDDMYYSPSSEAGTKQAAVSDDRYEQYMSTNDDQYLRMRVANRSRWSSIDDYDYWYDSRYDFGYGCSMSRASMFYSFNPYYMRPWTTSFAFGYGYPYAGMGFYPFYSYGGFYSGIGFGYGYGYGYGGWYAPMYTVVSYKNPKVMARSSANYLSTYRNRTYSNNNYNLKNYNNARYNNYNSGTRYNNTNGRYNNYNNNNRSYNNDNSNFSNSRPSRSFTPSTPSYSGSRSSGGSFGGGGGGGTMRSSSSGSVRPR